MRPKLTFTSRRMLIGLGGLAIAAAAILSSVAVAARDGAGGFNLSARLQGRSIGADKDGRGAAFLRLDPSARKLCYAVRADRVDKGRVIIGKGARNRRGHAVLTLFDRSVRNRGLSGCLRNVSTSLMRDMGANPGAFFVAVANHEFPKGAIRGQLRHSRTGPGGESPNSATDCYVYVYDDTGEGHDFATGTSTTPTPVNGTGVRYLAGEDHSATTCIVNRSYTFANGTIKVYAKDRLIGSNVYSCTASGVYKCFGPRDGSTLKGWTLTVVYYVCRPGASPLPYYCPR